MFNPFEFARGHKKLSTAAAGLVLFAAGCGETGTPVKARSAPVSAEAPNEANPASTAEAEETATDVKNTAAEVEEEQEIEGSAEGFPLDIEITRDGSEFEITVTNNNDKAASDFTMIFNGSGEADPDFISPINLNVESIDASEGLKAEEVSVNNSGDPTVEPVTIGQIMATGLNPGKSCTVKARFQEGTTSVHVELAPHDSAATGSSEDYIEETQ